MEKIKNNFVKLLKKLAKDKKNRFSGLGLILYDQQYLKNIPTISLKPSILCPNGISIQSKKAINYLLEISENSHILHDGFHFFNHNGILTHISQFLAPPICPELVYNELNGSRYLTALYVSKIKGVIATGIITQGYNVYYFENGKSFSMSTQWNKIYKGKPENYKYYDLEMPHEDMGIISKLFKKRNVQKILDLGCGSGRNLVFLLENGFEVYGLDISEEGIKKTKKVIGEKKLQSGLAVGDVFEKLPYPNSFFDAVISVQTLQHGTENQIKKAIKEIKRILKPKGILFVTLCGRISKGRVRYCLVKTAKKIAPRTYLPTLGDEIDLTHYIYDKKTLLQHYNNFKLINLWKDSKDFYCFLGENTKND